MHNSFHTAQAAPQRGEAAGLRTPAASHLPLPSLGCVPVVTFKLFVHYSFIIRSYSCILDVTISWDDLWVSWQHLGES